MNIEDMGEVKKFEAMPTEGTLYLTAVRYMTSGTWTQGPSGMDKPSVLASLNAWGGIDRARIYAVTVPLTGHKG